MKIAGSVLAVAITVFIISGCASTAHVEKDDAVNFNNYKTFAWQDQSNDSGAIKKNSLQETSVRQAVNAELAKANWREEKNHPDIILKNDLQVDRKISNNSDPFYTPFFSPYGRRFGYIYPAPFGSYGNDRYVKREGTLTISMIDAKTDKVVWQGWNTGEVNSRNLTSKEIQGSVKHIFRKFDLSRK